MSERIQLAGGVILNEDYRMLLLHRRTPKLTQWEMPGGKLKPGEESETAMRRELREELGITVVRATFLETVRFSQQGVDYEYDWYNAGSNDVPRIHEPQTFDEFAYVTLSQLNSGALAAELSPNMLVFRKRLNDGEIRLES